MITRGNLTIFTKDDVVVTTSVDTFEIETSAFGKVDERRVERKVEVSFTPAGMLGGSGNSVASLFPYLTTKIGESIFGDSDISCVVADSKGRGITIKASAITKMPDLMLSATKTMLGSMTITGIQEDNSEWDGQFSIVSPTGAGFNEGAFDLEKILTQPYSLSHDLLGTNIGTLDGIDISLSMSTTPITTDAEGIVDYVFTKLDVQASFTPIGLPHSAIIDALQFQGAGARRGSSLNESSSDLVLAGLETGATVTLKSAAIKSSGLVFSATKQRNGQLTAIATRANPALPLMTIAGF